MAMETHIEYKSRKPRWGIGTLVKNHASTIIVGVIIGIIVVALTPLVEKLYATREAKVEQKTHLSEISLGLSYNYINSLFGNPIVENSSVYYLSKYQDYEDAEITTAAYKLNDCVLLCMYDHNSLAAFVVVVNKQDTYYFPSSLYLDDLALLDYTYAELVNVPEDYHGNMAANNDDYPYYYEVHYGGGAMTYNSYILGSYKDYISNAWIEIAKYAQDISMDKYRPGLTEEEYNKLLEFRKNIYPNVFGLVSYKYVDDFNFVFDIVGTQEVAEMLFNDWWTP